MPVDPRQTVYYRRARFSTRLPKAYRFAPSHYWLREIDPGVFRVGMTKFATRMLGDFVERELQIAVGEDVTVGQSIGWIEGFKAIADIYCVVNGKLLGINEDLDCKPILVDNDPYDEGWLYVIQGRPAENCVDCDGYVSLLDLAIDRMLKQQKQEKKNC